jgi:hypothetical protein
MAERTATDPQGYEWTIRERWLPRVEGLPPNALADAFDGGTAVSPLEILLLPLGLAWSLLSWLGRLPLVAVSALVRPPWIDAVRRTGPPIHMTWRARNRFVGPKVIEAIAANVRRGDFRTEVENATFEGFDA